MKRYGLIGYPLGHSFSKGFFTEKFLKENITDCQYEAFPIPEISQLITLLSENSDIKGLNVTIPYKEKVLQFLDEKSEVVQQIGACNCIKIDQGRLKGFNTDVFGFEKSLTESFKILPKYALILGTGGAAKAVEFVLSGLGIDYLYVSRNPSDHMISYNELSEDLMSQYKLIINTSPLGMYPKTEEAPPIPYQFLSKNHCLFDLIYNPSITMFMKLGAEKGAQIQNGLDMLIYQAEESWRIWNY